MVFGEPDIKITTEGTDGNLTVEVRGVDVYDPTTGQIRSSSTDDIACGFVDTDYNGESFFVRHAYFTGGDEPYEKLKRALRAEIDEGAWSTLYSTVSLPYRFASSDTCGSKAKPQTTSTSKPTPWTASFAASFTCCGPTVRCSGPMETATRRAFPSASVYSPAA